MTISPHDRTAASWQKVSWRYASEVTPGHVRGYKEEGTTTTPFDMVVLNQTSRYDICMDVLRRSRRQLPDTRELTERCRRMVERHHAYVEEHLEDIPEIRDWTWRQGVMG